MKYFTLFLLFLSITLSAQETKTEIDSKLVKGLKFRNIGPAFSSGRIADIAIHPDNENIWYVAVGSGNVWKTENAGTTWKPIFDGQSSYSIGCVTIDPNNPSTIWIGTGENVGGRHVGYGDGIYRSRDGGKSWENMGLEASEHISKIVVHPETPDVIYVAAQGPLWSKGGDRGLFISEDGGKSWKQKLSGNAWTGVTDIAMDPCDPNTLYAATWQRHRTVAAYMGGGPGSGIHRSTDGGETWEKLSSGLPKSNMGKIGIAVSPFNPDIVYAAITLDRRRGGLYISHNRGASWKKQSDAVAGGTGPHYYQELYASPHSEGTIYLMDVQLQISNDHGKTFRRLNANRKHVDNHALAFNNTDPDWIIVGTDGGLYETFDNTESWKFVANLPVTQYYKLALDDAKPFYNVFGGTQDNGTHAGPSRTIYREGIRNADWQKILGGDGHQTATEPGNPGIVYGQSQQGNLHRIDRVTGEQLFIQPQAALGEPHERFNWDAPILVSAHDPARIYFASYRVWRSENRGDSWDTVSGDLTKGLKRMELPIMGRKQSWDNPWDIYAMSNYSTITSLGESPINEKILYAGTDDGLIHVTLDGGESWNKIEVGSIEGIPATAFVNDIRADLFDANTVYAALDNHKYGDFKPYLIKSTNAGKSWSLITDGIADRTLVWRIVQDHLRKELMFAATEFGIYFTIDGGERWIQMKGGLPTISFRDIQIHRMEDDLVGASFGRGFYILDDLSPLRNLNAEMLAESVKVFPVQDVWLFKERSVTITPGDAEYRAKNPPFGAIFTYYLKEDMKSLKQARKAQEKILNESTSDIPFPGWEALEKERTEDKPFLVFTVKDENGKVVNHVKASAKKGIHRVNWDLRYASGAGMDPEGGAKKLSVGSRGYLVTAGTYTATLYAVEKGEVRQLSDAMTFEVKPLHDVQVLKPATADEIRSFKEELEAARLEYSTINKALREAGNRVEVLKNACFRMNEAPDGLLEEVYAVEAEYLAIFEMMRGQSSRDEVGEKKKNTPGMWLRVASRGLSTTYGPTGTHRESLQTGIEAMKPVREQLRMFTRATLPSLGKKLKEAGAPLLEEL
ncbi:MAG TPA: hypothetical protein VJ951_01950 [Bacteroidales bacterium]|nr:hypothetical protein [Bacteroidales bacterium]